MVQTRTVEKIQEALGLAAREVTEVSSRLGLGDLMSDLEAHYPPDMDSEAVGEGIIPPPLAWDIHADVGNAKILLEEVIESLEKASRHTGASVEEEWLNDKLSKFKDSPLRQVLSFLASRRISVG